MFLSPRKDNNDQDDYRKFLMDGEFPDLLDDVDDDEEYVDEVVFFSKTNSQPEKSIYWLFFVLGGRGN